MSLKTEIIEERKKRFGLNETDTKKIYDKIFSYYKQIMIQAPRNIIDYEENSLTLINHSFDAPRTYQKKIIKRYHQRR